MQRRASIPPAAVGKAEGSPQPARAGALAGQAGRLPYVGRAPVHGPIAHPEFEVGPAREPPESPPGFGLRQSSGAFPVALDIRKPGIGRAQREADDRGDFDAAAGEKVPGLNDPRSIDTDGVKIVLARLAAQLLDVLQRRVGSQQRVIDHAGQLVCRLQVSRRRFLGSG